jgi:hypothetical protein
MPDPISCYVTGTRRGVTGNDLKVHFSSVGEVLDGEFYPKITLLACLITLYLTKTIFPGV